MNIRRKEFEEMKHIGRSKMGGEKEKKKRVELKFLSEFGVVLCVGCGCCVAPHVVKGHLRDGKAHKGVGGKKIEEIEEWMMGLEGLAMCVEDVRYPDRGSLGVEEMEVFSGGCVCCWQVGEGEGDETTRDCGFVGGSERVMQEHGRKVHGWVNILKKGRRKNGEEREIFWRSGVKFQRFFRLNDWNVAFEVRRDVVREEEEEGGVSKGKGKE